LNLGFDEDAAMRQCIGVSLDSNPALQHYVEHADFLAGQHLAPVVNREYLR